MLTKKKEHGMCFEPWICTWYHHQDLSLFLRNARVTARVLCPLVVSLFHYLIDEENDIQMSSDVTFTRSSGKLFVKIACVTY